MTHALHLRFLGPELLEFSLDAFIDRQVYGPAFAGSVDREREPVQMLFHSLNTHLVAKLAIMGCSVAMSHAALGWLNDLSPTQCSLHMHRKGRVSIRSRNRSQRRANTDPSDRRFPAETYSTIADAMTAAAFKLLGMPQRLEALDRPEAPATS
jgi:hypothetical protein